MALDTTILVNAMKANMTAKGLNPSSEQISDMQRLAEAFKTFVESATITYSAGLVAPPGGGPVTGVFTNIIS